MSLLWSYSEQQDIRPISENKEQDWSQWATEVQLVKLKEMMGADFYQDVVQNPSTTANAKLIDGGTYTIGALTYEFSGLKYVLSYLMYERYIMESAQQDTYSGLVSQNIDDSQRIGLGERKMTAAEMRRLAEVHWKDIQGFVCENSVDYPYAKFTRSGNISYF